MTPGPVSLDFAGPVSRLPWLGLFALVSGAIATAVVFLGWQAASLEKERLESAIVQREASRAPAPQVRLSDQTRRDLDRIKLATARIQVPWHRLFDGLEAASSTDIALLSLQPEAGERRVQLTGEARNLAAVADFTRRLRKHGQFLDVHLVRHEFKQNSQAGPLTFAISARWGAE